MSEQIAKVIEVSSASDQGFVDAIEKGLRKCATTIKNIQGAWVNEMKVVTTPDGEVIDWRVNLKVTFIVD